MAAKDAVRLVVIVFVQNGFETSIVKVLLPACPLFDIPWITTVYFPGTSEV
jgi:hypothetical protein